MHNMETGTFHILIPQGVKKLNAEIVLRDLKFNILIYTI